LNLDNVTITQLIDKIESTSDYRFVYKIEDVELKRVVSINVKNERIEKVLNEIFGVTKTTFNINDKFVYLIENKKSTKSRAVNPTNELKTAASFSVIGQVLDASGNPLPGAGVLEKGTRNSVTTDVDGKFTIKVADAKSTLVFSFIGFVSQEISVNGQTNLVIKLVENTSNLDEVVVVGYGKQNKKAITSAISSISAESFKDIPVTSIEQGFASQMAGVEVIQSSGRPGQANQINIRGIGTITAGTSPLIVVDGLALSDDNALNVINPNDVESVQVLKDAASAAIYGSRGANGVIIVTTKKGKKGKPTFSFDSYSGFQMLNNKLDLMNSQEHAIWDRDARNNYYLQFGNGTHSINDSNAIRTANAATFGFNSRKAIIPTYAQPYLNGETGLTDTDWQDELYRNAKIENYQLSARGGSESTRYFFSLNYFNQEGIIINTDFNRISFRVNLDTDLSSKFKMGLSVAPSFIKENVVAEDFNESPVNGVLMALPYFRAYNPDGSLNISQQTIDATGPDQARIENPVASALLKKDERTNRQLISGGFLDYEIIQGLKAKAYFGVDFSTTRREQFDPSFIGARNSPAPDIAKAFTSSSERLNWLSEYTVNYDLKLGSGHRFDFLAGYTYQEESYKYSDISANNFPNDVVQTLNAGVITRGTSTASKWTLISYLSRLIYNYQDKYFFTGVIRKDGSSRFGSNNRWGIFPSLSAGYRISNESFFPKNKVFSDLKFRGSWGLAGNNQIGDFGSLALVGNANAIIGGNLTNGLAPTTSPNGNLGWESTSTTNLGIDLGLFGNVLEATVDYYVSTSKDLLLEVPVPAHSGFTRSLQNIGKVENKGIEFSLKANYKLGAVKVNSTFNVVSNKNKVLEIGPGQNEIVTSSNITRVGGELGASYGYKVLGIFTSQEQLNSTARLTTARIGDYIYADTNGDNAITAADRTIIGSIHPDYTFGFTTRFEYKGFDLATVIQGVQGVTIHNRSVSVILYNPEGWGNGAKDYFDNYYTPERGANAIYARPNALPTDNGFYRNTDILQEDASFIRVRNITFGYSLPKSLIEKIGVSSLRLYVSSKNPFTFTDFRGYNPEQRTSNVLDPTEGYGNYPLEKSSVIGINVNF